MKKVLIFGVCLLLYSCQSIAKNEGEPSLRKLYPQDKSKISHAKDVLKEYSLLQEKTNGLEGRSILRVGTTSFFDVEIDKRLVKAKTRIFILETRGLAKEGLTNRSIEIGDYLTGGSYVVLVKTPEALTLIEENPKVTAVYPYQPFLKIAKSDGRVELIQKAYISIWSDSYSEVQELCQKNEITIVNHEGNRLLVAGDMFALVMSDAVYKVEKYRSPLVFSVDAHMVRKAIIPYENNEKFMSGERVSLMDVGIDKNHPDLDEIGRVYDVAGDRDVSERNPHGTHLAGIINGQGVLSSGKVSGVNPGCEIDFYAMGDDLKGLVVPASLQKYLDNMLKRNSHIVNLSWGTYNTELPGKYLSISRDIDQFVYNHPEMIVVVATGNDGESIASPATAKNVLSVGALDGNKIASYSGRGGANDGRFKPEILVQGSGILSTGLNRSYVAKSGSSQAAALLSGMLSHLYQKIQKVFNITPTQSMIKAFLLANTIEDTPDKSLGFGKLYFDRPLHPGYFKIFALKNITQVIEKSVVVQENDKLSFVLAWTDPPASESSLFQLINDYDLEIVDPQGKRYVLNDHINNVEKITIPQTMSGKYQIRIIPKNIPFVVKDIFLVVKSGSGFGGANQQNTQNETVVQNDSESTSSFEGEISPQNQGEPNESISESYQLTENVVTPDSEDISQQVIVTSLDSENAVTVFESLNQKEQSQDVLKMYVKGGTNYYRLQALGSEQGKSANIQLEWQSNILGLATVSVATNYNEDAYPLDIILREDVFQGMSNIIAQLKVLSGGNSNTFSVQLEADLEPPVFGDSYPDSGGILTNQEAWIILRDEQSGVDTNFNLSVNGVFLNQSQYDYQAGNGKITLAMDKILETNTLSDVRVGVFNVKDNVGNSLTNTIWTFHYQVSNDNTPPDRPEGLTAFVSNKAINLSWISNQEKDLAGYDIYEMSVDGLDSKKLNKEVISGTNFIFTSKNIDTVALTAIDNSGNESEPALLSLNYHPVEEIPEIIIKDVPKKTNENVTVYFQFRNEGPLIVSNVMLNGMSKISSVVWGEWSHLNVDREGTNLLEISVLNDDSNWSTNSISFIIDTAAPNMPDNFKALSRGKDIMLTWNPVTKEGIPCRYRIEVENEEEAASISTNTYYLSMSDYGRYWISVSAVDKLGNQSAENYLMYDSENGLIVTMDRTLYGSYLESELLLAIASNHYETVRMTIVNEKQQYHYDYSPSQHLSIYERVESIPDGNYLLQFSILSNGQLLSFTDSWWETNITIDHSAPEIQWIYDNKVFSGNYLVVSNQSVAIQASDPHFSTLQIENNGIIREYWTNSVALIQTNTQELWHISAYDQMGNKSSQSLTVVRDRKNPVIWIDSISDVINGSIGDEYFASYTIYTNDEVFMTSEYPAFGFISVQPMEQGSLRIEALDLAGNKSVYETNISRSEWQGQVFGITLNGSTNIYLNTNAVVVEVISSNSNIQSCQYSLHGEMELASGDVAVSYYQWEGLPDGDYTLDVVVDGHYTNRNFVVDTTFPLIEIKELVPAPGSLSNIVIITEKNLHSTIVMVDGVETIGDEVIEAGSHVLKVRAIDKAGNLTEKDETIKVLSGVSHYQVALFDGIQDNGFYNHPVLITLTNVNDYQIFINGNQHGARIDTEGAFQINVRGVERTNNIVFTNKINITLDFSPPSILCPIQEGGYYPEIPQIQIDDINILSNVIRIDGVVLEDTLLLSNGGHTIVVEARDKAGNKADLERNFFLDNELPVIALSPGAGVYSNVEPALTVEDRYLKSYSILLDGNAVNSVGQLDQEGKYRALITAEDKAGNRQVLQAMYEIDQTPPQIALNVREGMSYGTNLVLDITSIDSNALDPILILNGETNAPYATSSAGYYQLTVIADDKAGNRSLSNVSFTVFDNPPQIVVQGIEGLSSDGIYYYSESQLGLKITVSNSTLLSKNVTLDGLVKTGTIKVKGEGEHVLVAGVDVLRDGQTYHLTKELKIIIDKTAPLIVIQEPQDQAYYTGEITLNLEASDHISQLKILLNGVSLSNHSMINADGDYTLEVIAVDYLSRTNQQSLDFLIDQAGIIVRVDGISNQAIYNHTVEYSVVNDSSLVKKLSASLDGKEIALSGSIPGEGKHTFTSRIEDGAGIVSLKNYQFIIDKQSPLVLFNGLTDYQSLTGINATVTVEDPNLKAVKISVSGNRGFYWETNSTVDISVPLDFISEDDDYTVSVLAQDLAGHLTVSNSHFSIDRQAPYISVEGVTNDGYYPGEVAIRVGSSDAHFVHHTIELNGQILDLDPWMEEVTFTVAQEGIYSIKVTATDMAGNEKIEELTFTIDKTYPVIHISGVDHEEWSAVIKQVVVTVNDINTNTLVIHDTLSENGPTYVIQKESVFSTEEEGRHNLQVTATDMAGNTTKSNTTFVIDYTAPVIGISGMNDGEYRSAGVITLSAVAKDIYPKELQVHVDGQLQNNATNFQVSGDQRHEIAVYAMDMLSNQSWFTNYITLDTQVPEILVEGVTNGQYYNSDRNIHIRIVDATIDPQWITITHDNEDIVFYKQSGDILADISVVDEQTWHNLTISVIDRAGNKSEEDIFYSLDKTKPVAGIIRQNNNDVVLSEQLSFSYNDEAGGSGLEDAQKIAYYIKDGTTTNGGLQNGENVTIQGRYNVYAYATDRAGNQADIAFTTFYVDTTPPEVNFVRKTVNIDPTTQEEISLGFNINDNSLVKKVSLYDGDTLLTSITNLSVQNYSFSYRAKWSEWGWGSHVLKIVTEDVVGNQKTVSHTYRFKDETAPTISLVFKNKGPYHRYMGNYTWGDGQNFQVEVLADDKYGIQSVIIKGVPRDGNTQRPTLYPGANPGQEKTYVVDIMVTDKHGNYAKFTRTFKVDKKGPKVSLSGNLSRGMDDGVYSTENPYARIYYTITDTSGISGGQSSIHLTHEYFTILFPYYLFSKPSGGHTFGSSPSEVTGGFSNWMWFKIWPFSDLWAHTFGTLGIDVSDNFGNRTRITTYIGAHHQE